MQDDDTPSLANRMAAARAAWQRDARMQREPAPAEALTHVPQFISSFRAFEVMHGIEMKETERRNSISDIRDFEDLVGNTWQSRQMPIEKIRQLPNFVSEQWVLFGRKEDGSAHQVGQFATEDMARDVLGGITGDRNYDQHPAQDWTQAVAWSKFSHDTEPRPSLSLSERMRDNYDGDDDANILRAQQAADRVREQTILMRHGIDNDDPKTMPVEKLPAWREAIDEAAQDRPDRPNERLIGRGYGRW